MSHKIGQFGVKLLQDITEDQELERQAVDRTIQRARDCDPELFARTVLLNTSTLLIGDQNGRQKSVLGRILSEDYELSEKEQAALIEAVISNQDADKLLDDCIIMLKRVLGVGPRLEFVSQLWELVLSDGHLHQLEGDYIVDVGRAIDLTIDQVSELMTC